MEKFAAMLVIGLAFCCTGSASAQEKPTTLISYPVVQAAENTGTGLATPAAEACNGCGLKHTCAPGDCICADRCRSHECCLHRLCSWLCYRALPNNCQCWHCCECSPHVAAFFVSDHGCCGCGFGGCGCANGGCANGGCANGGCANGGGANGGGANGGCANGGRANGGCANGGCANAGCANGGCANGGCAR